MKRPYSIHFFGVLGCFTLSVAMASLRFSGGEVWMGLMWAAGALVQVWFLNDLYRDIA